MGYFWHFDTFNKKLVGFIRKGERTMKKRVNAKFVRNAGILAGAIAAVLISSHAFAFSVNVEGTDVQVGGYIKAMLCYDLDNKVAGPDALPLQGDVFSPYVIVLDDAASGNDKRDDMRFHARESRLFVKTKTTADYGTIGTHFEGDFFGDGGNENWSNSRPFRIRHAYGTITSGNFTLLAGQTWTTFMDLPAATPVMDFNGDIGSAYARQAMLRYTYAFAKGNSIAIALENPDTGLYIPPYFVNKGVRDDPATDADETNPIDDENKAPDIIIKYWFGSTWGHVSPKLLIRQFSLEGETATAVCGSLTGHVNIGDHKVYFGGLYGEGMGRYGGLGVTRGAGLTAAGDIELVPFMAVYLGTKLKVTDTINFVAGFGYSENDKDASEGADAVLTPAANNKATSVRTFVTYKPAPAYELAFGVVHGQVETMGGLEGDGTRIQSYVKFGF